MASTEDQNVLVKQEYDKFAKAYDIYLQTPGAILETQLLDAAFKKAGSDGAKVLDLGGGTGIRARQVLQHGASLVDVVDISLQMLEIGEAQSQNLSSPEKIKWHQADCTKPLHRTLSTKLQPPGTYDIVLANWLFDHCGSLSSLNVVFANISFHLKPGGTFIGVRCADIQAPCVLTGKYGSQFKDFEEIEGGMRFKYRIEKAGFEIAAEVMEVSYGGSGVLFEKWGLEEREEVDAREMEVVKGDLEFWEEYLDKPYFVCVMAKKKVV